jgi:hypothetical protein
MVLDRKVADDETKNLMRLREVVDSYLKKTPIIGRLDNTSEQQTNLYYTDASHHTGTTRMSNDPHGHCYSKLSSA